MRDKQEMARMIHSSVMEASGVKHARVKNRRKFSKWLIVFTAIIQLAVSMCICWGLLVYGPFVSIRRFGLSPQART
jgi:hypothetical protein